jgi:hypothetical protein
MNLGELGTTSVFALGHVYRFQTKERRPWTSLLKPQFQVDTNIATGIEVSLMVTHGRSAQADRGFARPQIG